MLVEKEPILFLSSLLLQIVYFYFYFLFSPWVLVNKMLAGWFKIYFKQTIILERWSCPEPALYKTLPPLWIPFCLGLQNLSPEYLEKLQTSAFWAKQHSSKVSACRYKRGNFSHTERSKLFLFQPITVVLQISFFYNMNGIVCDSVDCWSNSSRW